MKSLLLTSTISIIATLPTTIFAADGTINFTGEIVAASCMVSAGSGTSIGGAAGDQIIDVNLGKVSSNSLNGVAGGGVVAGRAVNLNIDCGKTAADLAAIKMEFDPRQRIGC